MSASTPRSLSFVIHHATTYIDKNVGVVSIELSRFDDDSSSPNTQIIQGIGQLGGKDVDISVELFHRRVCPAIVGKRIGNPFEIERWILQFEINYKQMGAQLNKAIAGLDSAVWDGLAKSHDMSVYQLWCEFSDDLCRLAGIGLTLPRLRSQTPSKEIDIPVYASSISREIDHKELGEKMQRLERIHKINAFKIKIGKRMAGLTPGGSAVGDSSFSTGNDLEKDASKVRTVKSFLKSDSKLAADANGAYMVSEAMDIADSIISKENLWFFEESIPWFRYPDMRQFSPKNTIVLAGGEQEFRMDVWEMMLLLDSAVGFDIVQPDPGYCGGPSNALRILMMMLMKPDRGSRVFMPHSPQGDLHFMIASHLLALSNQLTPGANEKGFLECACIDDGYRQIDISEADGSFKLFPYTNVQRIADGCFKLKVDGVLGWGLEIDENWMKKASKRTMKMVSGDGKKPPDSRSFL